MNIDGWPYWDWPPGLVGWVALSVYTLGAGWVLFRYRATFGAITWKRTLAFFGLIGLGTLLALFPVWNDIPVPAGVLPPPGLPIDPRRPGLAWLVLLPAFLAGGWLGIGPAWVVGFFTGLARSGWDSHSPATPLEYAVVASVVAWLIQQDYRGRPAAILRHPAVGGLVVGLTLWPLLYFPYFSVTNSFDLETLEYVASMVSVAAPVFITQAALAGVIAEFIRWGWLARWPIRRGSQPPPYLSSLNRKLLFTLIPLFVLGIALLFWADITIALRVSTTLVQGQMERAARNASQGIPFFINTGSSLLSDIAMQEDWFAEDNLTQTTRLLQSMRTLPFYRQLTLLNADLMPVAGYPQGATDDFGLLGDEKSLAALTLAAGMPQNLIVTGADGAVQEMFITPVLDPETRQPVGVLIGRTDLLTNPLMQSVIGNFKGIASDAGEAFIVAENGTVIYRSVDNLEPSRLPDGLDPYVPHQYEDKDPKGTRRLVYYHPVDGHPWTIVIQVPHRVALAQATDIAMPIILILLLIGLILLICVSLIAGRVTRPAVALALAARRISDGELDQPVIVLGDDEVGRAGAAFEHMRQKLRARLDELGLLLRVSQSVSSSLNLSEALPPILDGALNAAGAAGVRVVLVPSAETSDKLAAPQVFAAGPAADWMAPLDRDVLNLTREEGQAVIENLARARAVLDVSRVAGKFSALVALPLRQESNYYGALWLGYDQPHTFTEAEVNFLATLAGQAAVAVANARLFEAAEQGRQRLAAILASTPDAVIVTGQKDQILLLNPAAEATFELTGQGVIGKPAADTLPYPALVRLLLQPPASGSMGELNLPSGRTLYASVSAIIGAEGQALGRVCVLRDVTHFKELDAMKSEFVATVSHDLRAPLTFMRGYATMLPMVGQLNDKQREFADKIIIGIEQMTKLIDDLLDLGRIEAGIGLARETCRLGDIVRGVVEMHSPHASNKGLTLTLDVPADLPPLSGDPTLLRQAITNLIDNAIKYTPGGGQVSVCVSRAEDKFGLTVTDTGLGIAPADQTRLFQKFFRVKQRGSTQVKGSGLGLAIVKSIVERHGGRVWVESKLGRGSTFYLELPQNSPEGGAA